jgi:poly-gamma-glutamate capsule biosynthesis protein CapA/YwtB (metallophosphatase superfamily)
VRTINIKESVKKRKANKIPYFLAIIISVISTIIFLLVTERSLAINAVTNIFLGSKREVMYPTYRIYLDNLGEYYASNIQENLLEVQFEEKNRFSIVNDEKKADIYFTFINEGNQVYQNYLLPVGHFYWIKDSVSTKEFENGNYDIFLNQETYDKYKTFLELKYPDLTIKSKDDLNSALKDESCDCIGLVEEGELSKDNKLLKFDDKYYLDTFDGGIPITISVNTDDEDINLDFVSNIIIKNIDLQSNTLNKDNIAKVNMTGVTALARRVAEAMATRNNYDYPAEKIGTFLSDADLTHTSNEISFVPGCSTYSGLRFCSRPESIEALKAIGVDVIELTGNHNNDFGSQYNTQTIQKYTEEGIGYFGGGLNSEDAAKPYIKEIDGTKIGFLGYNYYDAVVANGTNALAGTNKAGANPYSESKMRNDIEELKKEVDVVIVDFQFQECYSYPSGDVIYPVCYKPINNQTSTFRKAIDYGADIVVGTQAHQPQTYELYEDGVIFYGLGNLFFDQSMWIGTRQGMILTHYFNQGELIQTKITPTMYDSSLQVEVANQDDAKLLLELLNTARKSL